MGTVRWRRSSSESVPLPSLRLALMSASLKQLLLVEPTVHWWDRRGRWVQAARISEAEKWSDRGELLRLCCPVRSTPFLASQELQRGEPSSPPQILQRANLGGFRSKVPKMGQRCWDTSRGMIIPGWVPWGRVSDVVRLDKPYDLRKQPHWCVYTRVAQIQSSQAASKPTFLSHHAESVFISVLTGGPLSPDTPDSLLRTMIWQ